MKVNSVTEQALARAAEILKYQNKQFEIKRMEEHIQMEKKRLERLEPLDPDATKGRHIDVRV